MRVNRAQAAENREAVINTASRLFRELGFDGIGIKDLMESAGLTQGAFYKQFASKEDLTAQASRRALESVSGRWAEAAEARPQDPLGEVISFYLSMDHRENKADGCPVVALGSDAARQGADVKASFETGVREFLKMLDTWTGAADGQEAQSKAMAILSTMVGAMLLSRAVNDSDLAQGFLDAAADQVRAVAARKSGTHQSERRAKQAAPAANARPQRKTKRSQ